MKATLPIMLIVLLVVFVAAGTLHSTKLLPARSPEAAVQSLYDQVEHHNYSAAYSYVAPSSNVDQNQFYRDLTGKDGSLRTFSNLQSAQTKVLRENDNEALVRVNTEWSTAVGKFDDTRDLRVVKDQGDWKVVWPLEKLPNLPPQVIPVTYLRWDVIRRGNDDEWGAQNVEAPRVRIISMNALERDGGVIILGEIVNEDTVPAFVAVNATLLGKDGSTLGDESSFDKISHTLLPKEVSPFRIDFPGRKLSQVKSVRMQPTSLLVPASADPTIGVLHQRIETDARGHHVLQGELINESGQIVNIPHVLATYYDSAGKVIWVSDGYVDHALLPQVPQPFAVALRDDMAPDVHSYRVTVNQYSIDRQD